MGTDFGPGVKDKPHGHPLPSVVYHVTDCKTKLTDADGKTRESTSKADTANATPIYHLAYSREHRHHELQADFR